MLTRGKADDNPSRSIVPYDLSKKRNRWSGGAEPRVLVGSTRILVNKVRKISRAARYKMARSDGIPVFWHVGVPNFGDDINPWLFNLLSGAPIRLSTDRAQHHFLGVGSLLDRVTANSVIVGSGLLKPLTSAVHPDAKFVSIRGELSAEAVGCADNVFRGDPMVLCDRIFNVPRTKKYQVGIIPHVTGYDQYVASAKDGTVIIDPSAHPIDVIAQIGSCAHIASQSLHGLVVADALGVPNVWLEPASTMVGASFKFRDYFSTLDQGKEAISLDDVINVDPEQLPFYVSKYLYDKDIYLDVLCKTLRATPGSFDAVALVGEPSSTPHKIPRASSNPGR